MPGRESVAFQGWRKANESLFTSTVKHSCCLDFLRIAGNKPPGRESEIKSGSVQEGSLKKDSLLGNNVKRMSPVPTKET